MLNLRGILVPPTEFIKMTEITIWIKVDLNSFPDTPTLKKMHFHSEIASKFHK